VQGVQDDYRDKGESKEERGCERAQMMECKEEKARRRVYF
jgi:hypothetical protein